jgi:hypothetical protein
VARGPAARRTARALPNTVALADDMMDPDMDARFELGVEMLIQGLAALAR